MALPSLTDLKSRLRARVDNAARGSDVPAGIERGQTQPPTSSRERGRMRRRLRELRRLREAQLLELGALVLEANRHGRDDTPVIKRKAAEAAAIDEEARALADALATDAGLDTVVAAGIAGPCPTCGTLASTSARFCSTCGTPLDGRPDAAPRDADAPAPSDAAAADAAAATAGPAEPATTAAPASAATAAPAAPAAADRDSSAHADLTADPGDPAAATPGGDPGRTDDEPETQVIQA